MARMTPEMRETIELTEELLALVNVRASDDYIAMAALTSAMHAAIHSLFGEEVSKQWEAEMKKLFQKHHFENVPIEDDTKFWNLMSDVRLYDKPVAFGKRKAKAASAGK